MLASGFIGQLVTHGSVTIVDHKGRRHRFGDGTPPHLCVAFKDRRVELEALLRPKLAFPEAYMDGRIELIEGTLAQVADLFVSNWQASPGGLRRRLTDALEHVLWWFSAGNTLRRSRANVAHHYDLDDALYDSFLDPARQYSCAYFSRPEMTLAEAQAAKMRHLAAKLLLRPGQRVLDIGSGWGGLACYLAQAAGVQVTGLTLSAEQHARAGERAAEAGVADRVGFHLRDYRDEAGLYDRIVSVGMFEHVGRGHYDTFFARLRDLLREDGVAVLHSIGQSGPPRATHPWLRKYIFPGGYIPALSEVLAAAQRAGLWVTDVEILRLHYAETLRCWRERFYAALPRLRARYDERFCRMWELYLVGTELAFRRQRQMVFQIQLARRVDTVPLTRDYIGAAERALEQPEPSRAAASA